MVSDSEMRIEFPPCDSLYKSYTKIYSNFRISIKKMTHETIIRPYKMVSNTV